MTAPRIHVRGLRELRAALRAIDKNLPREVGKALKAGATIAAAEASRLARHRTGRLAASMRAGAVGTKAYVANKLIYAGVHEYGGRAGRRHATRITPGRAINTAIDARTGQIVDEIGNQLDQLAARNGF